MICKQCNREIDNGSTFCNWCGTKQISDRLRGVDSQPSNWLIQLQVDKIMVSPRNPDITNIVNVNPCFSKKQDLMFKDVVNLWVNTHVVTLAASTQATYNAPLKLITTMHGDINISDITAQDITNVMLLEREKGYSYKHAACILSIYKQVFNFAIAQGYMQINPTLAVRVPRGLSRGTREAPEDDLIRAIQKGVNLPFGLFAYFLLYTGFRVGEALGTKWSDIDWKRKTVHCHRTIENRFGRPYEKPTKTAAGEREVPLLPDLEKQLLNMQIENNNDYIFGIDGQPMTTSEMRSRWTNWANEIGYAELHETTINDKNGNAVKKTYTRATIDRHMLRHGYATIIYEAGIDELTAQYLMGHADISTTHRIYTHLRQCYNPATGEKLSAKFNEISAANT